MTAQVMHVDGDRLKEWQSVGVAEGLDTDQEIADFLIHVYNLNREEGSSPLLCRRCHVPLGSLCESCQSGRQSAPPPHAQPPSRTSVLPSGKNLSLNNQPSRASQSQTGTSLSPPESSQLQTRSDLPCIENSQSQTRSDLPCIENNQSQTRSDLTCIENNQSQTSKASSLTTNKKPDTSRPRRGSQSEQDPVGKSVEFQGPANFSQHPQLENPSRQSDPSVRSVLVKEEDIGDDDDDVDSAPCMGLISSDQAESSVLKQEDATATVQDVSVGAEELPQRGGDPWSEVGGRKQWGRMETKALTWLLDRYDLHAPSTWNDCALLLNAALHTSATGEEWRELAMRRKLLSPKTATDTGFGNTTPVDPQPTNVGYGNTRSADPQCKSATSDDLQPINTVCVDTTAVDARPVDTVSGDPQSTKTRPEGATSVDLEPVAPRRTGQCSVTAAPRNREPDAPRRTRSGRKSDRTSGKRSRGAFSRRELQDPSRRRSDGRKAAKLTVVRQSQRPGLRSSLAAALQVAPDPENNNNDDDTSFSSKAEQREGDVEDDGTGDARQVAKDEGEDSACPEDVDTEDTKEEVTASGVSSGEGLRSSLEDGKMSYSVDAPELSACNRLSWHYLGVADVDLPDTTQKRKSFKRSPNDRYQCKECSSSFTHRGILVKHIRLAHLKWRPYHCHVCSAAYATKTKLQRHINVAHTKIRPFCCEICGASFVDHYTLLGHRETHNEDRQYRFFCELCGKGYYGMRELKRHMETHSTRPTKSLLCWVCGKAVRTTQYLRIHMRTHSPEKAFTCGACHHVFTSKCALQKHQASRACRKRLDKNKAQLDGCDEETRKKQVVPLLRQRRERKPGSFQCDICHKHFSAKKNIYKHKRSVHGVEAKREIDDRIIVTDPEQIARYLTPKNRDTASLKFSCDICSKRYSSQESMRKHKNIVHFGRRDHKCDVCHKTFTRHTSLIEHKHNVHNPGGKSARPTSQCDICQKTFAAKNSLRKHLKTVHFGLLPHSCVVCGKKFASRYHLREHAKTSGHTHTPEDEAKVGKPSSTDSFHHVPSPHSPLPDTCSKASGISPPSSCASPTLGPLSPWTHMHPASGGLTPLQHMSVGAIQQRELPTSASTVTTSLQPVHLWNMS